MNTQKRLGIVSIAVAALLATYLLYTHVGILASPKFLGGVLFVEILTVCIWRYEKRFFALLVVAFLWSGMYFPLQSVWTSARWVVLVAGAVAGFIVWTSKPHPRFSAFHLMALFCAASALVSARVSLLPQMAGLKALSLFLLFLYCSTGARAAMLGREENFINGLQFGCEVAVYVTVIAYFILHIPIFGNPNSLGAAMSICVFPILLWGWYTSDLGLPRKRRLAALLLCTFLICFSLERAGIAAASLATLAFCLMLRQYRLLVKVAGVVLFVTALIGVVKPEALNEKVAAVQDSLFYKGGNKEAGVLGSRWNPWQQSVSTIKKHPWLGTGFGTSLSVEEPTTAFGTYSSMGDLSREHGSSYMTIVEWVGLLGMLPFAALIGLNALNVLRVGLWLRRSRQASHYSVPLALVLLAGFAHAGFEDWLFAVGSYPAIFFWSYSFILADFLVPVAASVPVRHGNLGYWQFSTEATRARQ